jgi:hypothetical protein
VGDKRGRFPTAAPATTGVPRAAPAIMAAMPRRRRVGRIGRRELHVIVLGLILLILGLVLGIGILWTIGVILLVVGLILELLGAVGRTVGPRRHYWSSSARHGRSNEEDANSAPGGAIPTRRSWVSQRRRLRAVIHALRGDGGHGILPVGGHRKSPLAVIGSLHRWPSDLPAEPADEARRLGPRPRGLARREGGTTCLRHGWTNGRARLRRRSRRTPRGGRRALRGRRS